MTFSKNSRAGFTLAEILIAMGLLIIVGGMSVGSFIFWLYGFNRVDTRFEQILTSSIVANDIRENALLAKRVIEATSSSVSLVRDGVTYQYFVNADGELMRISNLNGITETRRIGSSDFDYNFSYLNDQRRCTHTSL